jgi:hypothetical protein
MGDVQVASTTDTQEQVNQAAGTVQEPEEAELEQTSAKGDKQVDNEEPNDANEPTAKDPYKKRIGKLTAEKTALADRAKSAEQRASALELELAEARKAKPAVEPVPAATEQPEPAESADPEPTQDKFDTYEKWIKAQTRWEIRQEVLAQEAKAQKLAQQKANQKREEDFTSACEEYGKINTDFDEIISESKVEVSQVASETIKRMSKEAAPRVMLYLAKNPDIAKELRKMTIADMLLELGSIKTMVMMDVSRGTEEPVNARKVGPDKLPVSSAPPPIKGLSGHSTKSAASLADPDIPYADWRKLRDEQAKARFRR